MPDGRKEEVNVCKGRMVEKKGTRMRGRGRTVAERRLHSLWEMRIICTAETTKSFFQV